MTGHGSKFKRKMEAAIAALHTKRTIEEAARGIDVCPHTLRRWMKMPEFNTAFRESNRAALSQTIGRAQQVSGVALSTLVKIMLDSNAPEPSRVRAAGVSLNFALRGAVDEDIEARVGALEQNAERVKTQTAKPAAKKKRAEQPLDLAA